MPPKRKQPSSTSAAASSSSSSQKPVPAQIEKPASASMDVTDVGLDGAEPEAKRTKVQLEPEPASLPADVTPSAASVPAADTPAITTSTSTTTTSSTIPSISAESKTPQSAPSHSSQPSKSKRGGGRKDKRGGGGGGRNNDDWSTPRPPREGAGEGVEGVEGEKEKRLPKRKVAVLVGYRGTGYSGSQINPGVKTIENDVFQAFVKAGCVSADNAIDPSKVAFQRSARTDAGVHAVGNVMALKLILNPTSLTSVLPGPPTSTDSTDSVPTPATASATSDSTPPLSSLIAHINSFLPPAIRIWSIVRVQTSFNARDYCDSRRYEYSLPSYALLPPKPGCPMHFRMKGESVPQRSATSGVGTGTGADAGAEGGEPSADLKLAAEAREQAASSNSNSNSASSGLDALGLVEEDYANCPAGEFWDKIGTERTLPTEVALKRRWRADKESLERLQDMLKMFHGSHNFHNFTVGKDFKDRSAQRVIKGIEVLEPFMVNGYQWISIRVHGQSFMLHQIRKMVGFAVLATRIQCPSSLLPEMFGPYRLHVPKAPARGLLLESPIFEGYNRKVTSAQNQNPHTESREPILFHDFVTTDEGAKAFRQEMIYQTMWGDEEADAGFAVWLQYLDHHRSDDFGYFNPAGTIPESAYAPKASAASTKGEPGGLEDDDEEDVKVGNGKAGGMYMEG